MMALLASVDVGPTKETVGALLEYLVDPLLPVKCSSMGPPSNEHLVAKQVHAAVLLYNYYHRKQNPGLEFLELNSFCKLAVDLKPSLQSYLSEDIDKDKHMSLTEKEIVIACDVSRSLDASNDKPIIEGWPVAKVCVFLVDSKKEKCYLFYSSITQGVWSVIEKEVSVPGEETANKKKRVIKKTPKESTDEAVLRQVAYSAVKEACVFSQGDLKIMETHTVYSTSKAKTAVRLYIMQCTHFNLNDNAQAVPICDALESLRGPLVRNECGSWLLTPVVEYFHLLPFADNLSDWLSKPNDYNVNGTYHVEAEKVGNCHSSHLDMEKLPNPLHDFEKLKDTEELNARLNEKRDVNSSGSSDVGKEARNNNNHQMKEEVNQNLSQHCVAKDLKYDGASNQKKEPLPYFSNHSEMSKAVEDDDSPQRKDVPTGPAIVYKKRNRPQKDVSSNYHGSKKSNATEEFSRLEKECPIDPLSSSMDVHEPLKTGPNGIRRNLSCDGWADDQKQIVVAQEPDQSAFSGGDIVVVKTEDSNTDSRKQNAVKVYSDQDEKQDHAIVSLNSDFDHLRKMQHNIASKEDLLLQSKLEILFSQNRLLSQQLRIKADEYDFNTKQIEVIIKGGEVKLGVLNNSVMERNDFCERTSATEYKTGLPLEGSDLLPPSKRKRLSETTLSSQDPCRELDSICIDNNWTLPTYNISTLEGGFQASVTIKGEGTVSRTPQDARNSAALHMLAKLQNIQTSPGVNDHGSPIL